MRYEFSTTVTVYGYVDSDTEYEAKNRISEILTDLFIDQDDGFTADNIVTDYIEAVSE